MRPVLHILLHFIVPLAGVHLFRVKKKFKVWVILCATMVVDLDHLLATPIYDPDRCSIGFHPLHSYVAIAIYCACLAVPRIRLVAIGLLIHMGLDYIDCLCMP